MIYSKPFSSPPHRLVDDPSLIASTVDVAIALLSCVILISPNLRYTFESYVTNENRSHSLTVGRYRILIYGFMAIHGNGTYLRYTERMIWMNKYLHHASDHKGVLYHIL